MTEITPLDTAHATMQAAPDDDTARLRFYERLADGELFVLLSQEAAGDNISPALFNVADGPFVLAFDREERLAQFTGQPAPYAALSGRVLAQMLSNQPDDPAIGIGLNLEVAPSSILIPADAVAWLHQTLGQAPDQIEARISEFTAPTGLPEALITALDTKLATAAGLATEAYLVGVVYEGGSRGHLLGFVGAVDRAQSALAKAAGEALTFTGIEAGMMDVGFFAADDPVVARLAATGLRFDLPQATAAPTHARTAPGSDPDSPPILR
ncbi:MAG: hypothetical protein ACI8R4_004332 [Paracoccaceae bacterium]|jgi:hypothetical protein